MLKRKHQAGNVREVDERGWKEIEFGLWFRFLYKEPCRLILYINIHIFRSS